MAHNYNLSEVSQINQDGDEDLTQVQNRFWKRDVAYPSKLLKNMPDLRKIYQLRYDVYCMQKGFLDPKNYPDKCEKDIFDQYALHFGAFDNSGNALGTLRLVQNSDLGFPMMSHCNIEVPDNILRNTGEISRLAVSKMIRKRQGDGDFGMPSLNEPIDGLLYTKTQDSRRQHRPDIVVGLYKSLYQESKRHGITHWIAAMEPGLLKLLKRFYFDFESIGPEVDYYGPVRPYMVSLESIEDQVYKNSKPFYEAFVKGLPQQLIKHRL